MLEIETMKVANSCLGYESYKKDFTIALCDNNSNSNSCKIVA